MNPSFRVVTLDAQTKLPIKLDTYTLDLEKANQDDKYAKFELFHEFTQEYSITDLSPASVMELADKINNDEETAKKYEINKFAHGKGSWHAVNSKWNESCRRIKYCHVSNSVWSDIRDWLKLFDFDMFDYLSYLTDFMYGVWVNKKQQ